MKTQTNFVCQECGMTSPKFLGKCPECGLWNTLKEFKIQASKLGASPSSILKTIEEIRPRLVDDIKRDYKDRILTTFSEIDTVLGGGIVAGSVVLLAGDPGIGKSTLLLQLALKLSSSSSILYISGEESEQQIKLRAERLSKSLKTSKLYLVSTTDTDSVAGIVSELSPSLVIIDSIQTMQSENLEGLSGSVGQIRYATAQFIKIAKTLNTPVILVGHVTKEGMVAGPMILSHMVDTVLFLEGEKTTGTRVLRSLKNRFGPIDEVGIFSMQEQGLVEVKNPQELFANGNKGAAGSILTVTLEGSRAFLVEIQALAVFSKLPMPRRIASGIDYRRLELILAVLQKHARLPLDTYDIFVNVAGGFKLNDTASDLAVALAVFSSLRDVKLGNIAAISELGLLGELRQPPLLDKRIKEAKKIGVGKVISSKTYRNISQIVGNLK
ncbi:MAG: DNA repair protein RadA [Candidatus Levybacteria bacterium RIFCSPHIGHO2_01_FULL_37_17]|nr:MAG: DNA repair protein RadA [Candidatus Levybacteria bacterium RIFCSPHIGHO2_01_FULL_37_17]OGH36529.1 MAG: DNA repair protein RadA [Candidatus Levybacteria bacterium RIFCSPLOWO2_01_FULL_38_23]